MTSPGASAGPTKPTMYEGHRVGPRASELVGLLRLREAVLMTGFSAVAGVLGMTDTSLATVGDLAALVVCLALVSVSVYAANAWAGWREDANDPKFSLRAETDGEALRRDLGIASLILVMIGTAVWAVLLGWTAVAVVPMWLLWLAYSHPRGLKHVPMGGTLVHLAAGPWMVLVPYSVFRDVDARGLIYAAAVTLAFGSGHLNHELVDRLADAASGLHTSAVAFGARVVHGAGTLFAVSSYATIGAGASLGHVPMVEAVPFLVAGVFHGVFAVAGIRSGMTPDRATRYRTRYRVVFAAAVAVAVVFHLRSLGGV